MNAIEISDATLPTVTPADDDLMILYDVSAGTTGKTPISGIAPKVAENIDISTLPAVTPAADDVLMIRDTSEGTTGKATIADVVKKVSDIVRLELDTPVIKKQNDTIEGGEIVFESGGTSDLDSVFIDVYRNTIRIRSKINNSMNVFNIDFEDKTTYWT